MKKNIKKQTLLVMAFILGLGSVPNIKADTDPATVALAVGAGAAVTAATAGGALLYYYRLPIFVGLSGLEKKLSLAGFEDPTQTSWVPKCLRCKRQFKWYQWRLHGDDGWNSASSIKKDKKNFVDSLKNDIQQYVMAHEKNIKFSRTIELKKNGRAYYPVVIKKDGKAIDFDLEVYSVIKDAMGRELSELRSYLWLSKYYITSIKLWDVIRDTLSGINLRYVHTLGELSTLSAREMGQLKDNVRFALINAGGSEKETWALSLFFETLDRYTRLYQIDNVIGEYIAAKANGQQWPPKHKRPGSDEQKKQANYKKIDALFSQVASNKAEMPVVAILENIYQCIEERKELDLSYEAIYKTTLQRLAVIIDDVRNDRVDSLSVLHKELEQLHGVIEAIA